ncbi:MAG: (2Fe-2S)-binding protein [Aigarchaeota archaeon]|nr:(2Fe-2S)-binding protein [Candidatus Pelearchaeum maunauluense]
MAEELLKIRLTVNGREYEVGLGGSELLIDVLRDRLGLKSVKEGCGEGDCGLCLVIADGVPIHSCLVMAFQADGKKITTVEGLGDGENLHPIQRAFIDVGAVQCGYCIPAAILAAKHLIDTTKNPSREEIRRALRSVLCRCGSYIRFEQAILKVVGKT